MLAVLALADGEGAENVSEGTGTGSKSLIDHILERAGVTQKECLNSC